MYVLSSVILAPYMSFLEHLKWTESGVTNYQLCDHFEFSRHFRSHRASLGMTPTAAGPLTKSSFMYAFARSRGTIAQTTIEAMLLCSVLVTKFREIWFFSHCLLKKTAFSRYFCRPPTHAYCGQGKAKKAFHKIAQTSPKAGPELVEQIFEAGEQPHISASFLFGKPTVV